MKFFPSVILIGIITLGVATIALSFKLSSKYTDNVTCQLTGKSHRIVIQGDRMKPSQVHANLCDKLTIINQDNKTRLIAFGEHDEHKSYDGVSEKFLKKNQSLEVTLKRAGNFKFHDHLQEYLTGSFTVTEPAIP